MSIVEYSFGRCLTLLRRQRNFGSSIFHWVLLTQDIVAKQNRARALIRSKNNTYRHCACCYLTNPRFFWFMEYLQQVKIRLDLWNISTATARTPRVHCQRLHTSRIQSRLSSNKTRLVREISQNSTYRETRLKSMLLYHCWSNTKHSKVILEHSKNDIVDWSHR